MTSQLQLHDQHTTCYETYKIELACYYEIKLQ